MAEKVKLSPTQLPEIYSLLPPICKQFGIAEPEFYLEMDPAPNAYTIGDKQTFLVVTSGLMEYLSTDEVKAVLAHECGHILCRHVFYSTLAQFIVAFADSLGFLGNFIVPVQLALKYWQRRSELSADRAELVYLRDTKTVLNVLVRLAGGPSRLTSGVNVIEYAEQAKNYQELQKNSKWHKLLQGCAALNKDHPFTAVRAYELLQWSKTEQYSKICESLEKLESMVMCSNCGKTIDKNERFCRFCGTKQN